MEENKNIDFEKSLNPVSVTFKTDSLLLDLERVLDKRELYILKKIYTFVYTLIKKAIFIKMAKFEINEI